MSALPSQPSPSFDLSTIEGKVALAQAVLERLLRHGAPVAVSWSAGKDSSVALNLLLSTAAALRRNGVEIPPIVVTHADTLVENPSMRQYARREMKQVMAYARKHRLNVRVDVATPSLTESWTVRVIGGRALPSFPGTNRDCSLEMKGWPMKRLRKAVLRELEKDAGGADRPEPVVLLGTRYSESTVRGANMRERGESDVEVRRGVDENGKPSHLFLSPIAHWSTDDVWEYLGMVRGGALDGYSDFEETMRVYADAMGVSCVIVAEDMSKAVKSTKACGARHGCAVCTATGDRDASMENMLERDERYAYMRPLNQLRNFLMATRWDMDRRSWLGRTIKNGYVRIGPDAYSPAMMEELLRYALTIDQDEREAAAAEGIPARFELVSIPQLFAIDAMWSLQAFHKPFHALAIWDEVVRLGVRYPVPQVPTYVKPKTMPERYLHVGDDWEDGHRFAYTGLRSVVHEMASIDNDGCMGNKELADGRAVLDMNTGSALEFELDVCYFVLDDLKRLMREYHDKPGSDPTYAYSYYAGLGMMSVKSGMQGEIDQIMRRSHWKVRQGVAGQIDGRTLYEKAVTRQEAGMTEARGTRVRGEAGSLSLPHMQLLPAQADSQTEVPGAPALPIARAIGEQLVIWMQPVAYDEDATEEQPQPERMHG